MRRLQVAAIIVGLVFAAAAVGLILLAEPWTIVLGVLSAIAALASVWVALWVPRKVGSIEDLYAKSPLVPAVVSEIHPRAMTLLSLIDIAKPGTRAPLYALVTRNVPVPAGRKRSVGDKVPSVALLSDRRTHSEADAWEMVSPMPIEWGTRDAAVHSRATSAIDQVEWDFLRSRIAESKQIRTSPDQRVILSERELPENLR
ncbi:histidine kinase [Rhodococcus sp. WMMA185]|nr:histidine kinase [Rhodococcus sp. WMMA185]